MGQHGQRRLFSPTEPLHANRGMSVKVGAWLGEPGYAVSRPDDTRSRSRTLPNDTEGHVWQGERRALGLERSC
jgi:hypothetical protein